MQPSDTNKQTRLGKVSWAAAAWLLGLPLPIIVLALIFGGCTRW